MTKGPLFSTYKQGENRVTSSMLAVFERIDLSLLETLLAKACGESSLQTVSSANQPMGQGDSVPDARISAHFSYWFEVKIESNALGQNQLREHAKCLKHGDGERLFLITPDAVQPREVGDLGDPRVTWFSFAALYEAIDDSLNEPNDHVSEQTRFLLRELQGGCKVGVSDDCTGHSLVAIQRKPAHATTEPARSLMGVSRTGCGHDEGRPRSMCDKQPGRPSDRTLRLSGRPCPALGKQTAQTRAGAAAHRRRLVCVAVAQAMLRCDDERYWLRVAPGRIGHLFPRLPVQSEYNRHLRALAPALLHASQWLARAIPSWQEKLRLMDGTPVPCGAAIWHNWLIDAPVKRSLIAYDHRPGHGASGPGGQDAHHIPPEDGDLLVTVDEVAGVGTFAEVEASGTDPDWAAM